MSFLAQARCLRTVRHSGLRLGLTLVATGLVIVRWPDVWLPAFLAIWQGVTLALDGRKAVQVRRDSAE